MALPLTTDSCSNISLANVRTGKIAFHARHVFRFLAAAFVCETDFVERTNAIVEFAFRLWKTVRGRSTDGNLLSATRRVLPLLRADGVAYLLHSAHLVGGCRHVRPCTSLADRRLTCASDGDKLHVQFLANCESRICQQPRSRGLGTVNYADHEPRSRDTGTKRCPA